MTEPFRAGMQRARIEPTGMHPALHLALDQPGAFEHLDVLRGPGQRDLERGSEFADGARLRSQLAQHRAAGRIGQRAEYGVEAFWILLNHMVEYKRLQTIVNPLVKYISQGK